MKIQQSIMLVGGTLGGKSLASAGASGHSATANFDFPSASGGGQSGAISGGRAGGAAVSHSGLYANSRKLLTLTIIMVTRLIRIIRQVTIPMGSNSRLITRITASAAAGL